MSKTLLHIFVSLVNMSSTEDYDGFHFALLSLLFFLGERINGVISEMIPGDQQYSSPYTKFNREKPQGLPATPPAQIKANASIKIQIINIGMWRWDCDS